MRSRRHQMYGNDNGLPGLPKTTYVSVGGRKVTPRPPAPRTQQRAPPVQTRAAPRPAPIFKPQQPIVLPSGPDPTLSRRVDTLELRISSTEQSNRTLLDEIMRLQQDTKGNVRKNEMAIQEERDSRSRLEMAIRQSQTKTHEVDDRIRRCEDGTKDNRGAIQQLSSHVQNIERMVTSLQQDQSDKNSQSGSKMQEYRNDISRIAQENEQLNTIVKNLREQLRDNKSRIDNFQDEVVALQNGLRLQGRLIEDTANKPLPKTPGVNKNIVEQDRKNNEAKIIQLNTTIQDLTTRLSTEASKREKMEQNFSNKLNQLMDDVNKYKSKGEKAQREYDEKMKEVQLGFSDTDKSQIRMEMSRVANDLKNKIDTNDEKIREETVDKLNIIEKTLLDENKRRETKEKQLETKLEKGIKNITEKEAEASKKLTNTLDTKVDEHKNKLSSLNKRMNEVEETVRLHKLEQEKLLEAEISERLGSDKTLDAKINDLEDDVQVGFVTLQNEVGALRDKKSTKKSSKEQPPPAVDVDEILDMQERKTDGIRQSLQKDMSALEKRLTAVETDVKQRENVLENRLQTSKAEDKEATSLLGDNMQQQIDGMVFKHNKLKKKVDELERDVSTTPKNLQTFKEDTDKTLEEMKKDLKEEEKERKDNVRELREHVTKIIGSNNDTVPSSLAQLSMDVDQSQTGLKKCAESIHVVKTLLGDKIKDEKKIREKQISIVETDVERLDTKIRELKERMKNSPDLNDTLNDFDDEF